MGMGGVGGGRLGVRRGNPVPAWGSGVGVVRLGQERGCPLSRAFARAVGAVRYYPCNGAARAAFAPVCSCRARVTALGARRRAAGGSVSPRGPRRGGPLPRDRMKILVAKVLCLLGVFVLMLLGSLLPVKLIEADYEKAHRSRKVLALCNSFGGGVFLATCFNALLPAVREKVNCACI